MSADKKLAALEIGQAIWGMVKNTAVQAATAVQDSANWVGGSLQGEFNQQATVGQILVDAVISMFPVAGEITAARDATAIGLRMHESEAALNDTWQWVSLVLCLLAVVPVIGGVLKGVGRLVVRAARKSEDLVKVAQEVLSFLRKMGYGDATQWLKALDFAKYQGDILNAVNELTQRISHAAQFIQQRIGSVLPQGVQNTLQAVPQGMARIQAKAKSMVPLALKELNNNLNKVRQHITDGSYIAPIAVAGKQSQVYVSEGRLVSQKVIVGHIEHPPASLRQYRKQKGWPDLEVAGRSKLKGKAANKTATETGHLWPINTFSAKAPMKAYTARPGEVLYRVLDKFGDKYLQGTHQAGDFWSPARFKSGQEFRTKGAVMHGWNANGYIVALRIPSKAQLEKMGLAVPPDWQGLRTWRGGVAGQLDNAPTENDLKATHTWLEGGGVQDFIDWSHPHNAPVKAYLLRTVQVKPTGWDDLQLPVNPDINTPHVVTLGELERSAKIRQEGYALRAAATVGKVTNGKEEK